MTSPFDSKNRVAAALDRLALRVLLFVLSVGYFFFLWHSGALSLLAGSALFILAMLTLLLLERRTLARRDHALRVRVGGSIALEELMLLPPLKPKNASARCWLKPWAATRGIPF